MNAPLSAHLLKSDYLYLRHGGPELEDCLQSDGRYSLSIANTKEVLRQAQALRFSVFTEEYQARIPTRIAGIDEDYYDEFCDHLLVRDIETQEVVGTYRILPPHQAKRIGSYYSETEFFINRLDRIRTGLVELGRSCVHPDHRNGGVIMLLWSGISRYMQYYGYRYVMGCTSVSMRDGGRAAAHFWDVLSSEALAAPEDQGFPKHPVPIDRIVRDVDATLPPLMKGYIRVGAKVCSPPSWDPDFNTADFLMLLPISEMNPRYARHFGIRPGSRL